MKKLGIVVASLIVASTYASAVDVEYFIGAGTEFSKTKHKFTSPSEDSGVNIKDTSLKLKTGVILDKTHRIYLSYSKASDKFNETGSHTKLSVTSILANYDYLYAITDDFRVGPGLHLGSAKFHNKGYDSSDRWDVSKSGFAYGAQVSAIYDITKNVEFEVGASYTKHNSIKIVDGSETDKIKNTTALYTGINFKF